MFYLAYTSEAVKPFDRKQLEGILTQARAANRKVKITGILLYKNDQILQMLEGDREAVLNLYGKIADDSRHKNITLVVEKETDRRTFTNWSMAFCKLPNDTIRIEGYNNFLNEESTGNELDGFLELPERLMLLFKRNQS